VMEKIYDATFTLYFNFNWKAESVVSDLGGKVVASSRAKAVLKPPLTELPYVCILMHK